MYELLGVALLIYFILILACPAILSFGVAFFVGERVKRKNKLKVQLLVLFICLILAYPLALPLTISAASMQPLTLEIFFNLLLRWVTNPYSMMITLTAWTIGAIIFYLKRPRETSAPSEDKSE